MLIARFASRLVPLATLLVAGCGPKSAAVAVAPSSQRLLIQAGGVSGTRTAPFNVAGRALRVEYHFSRTSGNLAVFAVERERGNLNTTEVARIPKSIVPSTMSGTFDVPLIPGRYRLRVDGPNSWTVSLSDVDRIAP